jgi:hypothetical protein
VQEIIEIDPTWSSQFSLNYYIKPDRSGLIPNRTLMRRYADGSVDVFFKTNALSLKGEQRDAKKKQAVVWGDSVVFGMGKSWVEGLNDHQATYQFHNGGMEGDVAINIMNRMIYMNREHRFDMNILSLGWHGNESFKARYFSKKLHEPDAAEQMLIKIVKANIIPGLIHVKLCLIANIARAVPTS